MKIELAQLQKDYDENIWNPFLDYELDWAEELPEIYLIISEWKEESCVNG